MASTYIICSGAIQKQLCNKGGHKFGTLILDEIKLHQAYDFNTSSYRIDGFVDYAGLSNEGSNELADLR